MTRRIALALSFIALSLPAAAETENPAICAALAGKPGLYLVRSTNDIEALPARQRQKLRRDIRIYVIAPKSLGNEEQVVHLRVTSKAERAEDNKARTVRLKRNSVQSVCRQSVFRHAKPDFDNDDDTNDSDVHDYNDFADKVARTHKTLGAWNFRWEAGQKQSNCQTTADHVAPVDGFGKRKPAKQIVRIFSVNEAVADTPQPEIASMTSVLVHQPNKGESCFAFRLFQNRDTGWTPVETRFEAWNFGKRPNRGGKRSFTLKWMP